MADAADWLLEALAAEGVEVVFGNPGSTELPLIDAFARQDRVRYVLGLHEMAVMGMADGYAQSTGRLAVVNVHVQPGIANAIAGVINAQRSRVPLLVTVGQQVTAMAGEQPFLGGDVLSPAAPFAKGLWEPRHPSELPGVIADAIRVARTPPCGPVVVSLPMDVLVAPAPPAYVPAAPGPAPAPDATEIAAIIGRLGLAERPVLLVGDGVAHAGVADRVTALANRLGAPMLTEPWASRISVHGNHPLMSGPLPSFGLEIARRLAPFDLAIAIGMPAFRLFGSSPGPTLTDRTAIIVLDEGPADLSFGVAPLVALEADLAAALDALLAGLGPSDAQSVARRARAVAARAAGRRANRRAVPAARAEVPFDPVTFCRALAEVIGPNDIVVDEFATSGRALRTLLGGRKPGSFYAHRGSALGWGLPAAVGIAMADHSRRVICGHGDGSLLFGIHALWTAAARCVPLAVIVADNGGYEILRAGMEGLTGRPEGNWPGLAIDDPRLDIVALARGFGVPASRVERAGDLVPALRETLARSRSGPVVLVVPVAGRTAPVGYPVDPATG
jgi:benzoylformate decarboxylase